MTINNKLFSFNQGDLILALYDFTDIKDLKDYVESTDSVPMSLFSATLNNFATLSSSYNVIKTFNFKIKITNDDYKIENIE